MRFIGIGVLTGLLCVCLPVYAILDIRVSSYTDIVRLAQDIQRSDTKDSQEIISIFEAMPYTANALSLISLLQPIEIMRSAQIKAWTKQAQSKLMNGQELITAVEQDDINRVKDLLKNKDIDLNFISMVSIRGSALVMAVSASGIIAVQMLLDAGADPNVERKKALIAMDAVSIPWKNEWPPLMFAVYFGSSDEALALIKAGANVNYKDSPKMTPLMYAASPFLPFTGNYSQIQVISTLIAMGADTKAKDKEGLTAKDWAKHKYSLNPDYLAEILHALSSKK